MLTNFGELLTAFRAQGRTEIQLQDGPPDLNQYCIGEAHGMKIIFCRFPGGDEILAVCFNKATGKRVGMKKGNPSAWVVSSP
jgi:hypothetical protein